MLKTIGISKTTIYLILSARFKRKQLNVKDIEHIKDSTPSLCQGSPRLFRNLRDKGSLYTLFPQVWHDSNLMMPPVTQYDIFKMSLTS